MEVKTGKMPPRKRKSKPDNLTETKRRKNSDRQTPSSFKGMDGPVETDSNDENSEDMDSEESDQESVCFGRKIYSVGNSRANFDSWLTNNLPSKIKKKDGYAWISVNHYSGSSVQSELLEPNRAGLMNAWRKFLASGRAVNYQNIKELASNYNVLSGKWLFFTASAGNVDHLWSIVARNIVCQVLPCSSAKVSTYEEHKSHVVCIYNNNFTDEEEVMKSEQAIRNMGIKCELLYKPDVFTHLGIYSGNSWHLRPYILKSVYNSDAGKSEIERFM